MKMHFAPGDVVVIGLFFALVLALGLSARLRSNSMLQFLAAGRSLTLPVFVATLVSTWYGGILGVGESIEDFGIGAWLLLGVPYYIFALIYALRMAGRVREADDLSLPERLERRWGRTAGLTGGVLVFLLAVPAAHVYMLGILIQALTGWGLTPCIVLGALLGAAFLLRGGLLADARMGVLAFFTMYVGFAAIDLYCASTGPIVSALKAHPNLTHLDGAQGPLAVISFFILGAWTLVDPAFHQRVTSSAGPGVAKRGILVSILCWMVFDLLSMTAGLYAMVRLDKLPDNPVAIYPAFADTVLPAGLKGLFFVGMAGTVISAMVGYTLVSGATLGREIIARLKPGLTDEAVTRWSRVGLFVGCGAAILLAYFVDSVVALWYSWAGALVGAMLIPVWVAYVRDKTSSLRPGAISLSMAVSFLVAFGWMVEGKRTHNDLLTVSWLGESFSLGTLVPALAISGIMLAGAATVERLRFRNAQHG